MLIQLFVSSLLFSIAAVAQTPATNSSQGQASSTIAIQPKQGSMYDDYDINEQKLPGGRVEGSGGGANLDEYADDEEEEQLSKITATLSSSTSTSTSRSTTMMPTTSRTTMTTTASTTTTIATTTTTTSSTVRRLSTTTTRWMKPSDSPKKKNLTTTTPPLDLDGNEFKDDHEEYADDLEDDVYYNEPTVTSKLTVASMMTTPRQPLVTTRSPAPVHHTSPVWVLLNFLTRPPIAVGILAGRFSRSIDRTSFIRFFQVWPLVFSHPLFCSSVLFDVTTSVTNLIRRTPQVCSIRTITDIRNRLRNSMPNVQLRCSFSFSCLLSFCFSPLSVYAQEYEHFSICVFVCACVLSDGRNYLIASSFAHQM